MARLRPLRFEDRPSPARAAHPVAKLLSLAALAFGAALAEPRGLALLGLAALGAYAAAGGFARGAGHGLSELLRGAAPLLPLVLLVAAFRILSPGAEGLVDLDGLGSSIAYLVRLLVMLVLAEAFFRSTSAGELAASVTAACRTATGRRGLDPGLYLSLALAFLPRCAETWERCREAWELRSPARSLRGGGREGRDAARGDRRGRSGAGLRRPGPGRRLRATLLVLESFVARSIRDALRSAEALELRGYAPGRGVDAPRPRGRDAVLVAAALGLALLAAAIG